MTYTSQQVFDIFSNLLTPSTSKELLYVEIFRHELFELKEVSLESLDAGYTDQERLNLYKNLITEPPPILLNYRMKIIDGFHRVKDQKNKKILTIMAYIPIDEPKY